MIKIKHESERETFDMNGADLITAYAGEVIIASIGEHIQKPFLITYDKIVLLENITHTWERNKNLRVTDARLVNIEITIKEIE